VRRIPKIESCLIILISYASYFFSNGVHMSGGSLSMFRFRRIVS
jgi:NhaP-type Na+/H+ or K+/H+ antiporter